MNRAKTPGEATNDERFLRRYRIHRGADFQRVYQRRRTASDGVLLVHACENGLPHPRLGLSVSRQAGSAARRNRWKRLVREAFRLCRHKLPGGVDLVVIPRQNIEPDLTLLLESLPALAQRVSKRLPNVAP